MDAPQTAQSPSPASFSAGGFLKKLEDFFVLYLVTKAPFQMPTKWKEIIVKISPWANIIGIVLIIPILLLALGLSSFVYTLGLSVGVPYGNWSVLYIVLIVDIAFYALFALFAIPGLFKRSRSGWKWLYYSLLFNIGHYIIDFSLLSLIFSIIPLYVTFQIREYYK